MDNFIKVHYSYKIVKCSSFHSSFQFHYGFELVNLMEVIVFLTTNYELKVSGPFVETSCVFQFIKNIINAENVGMKKRL